MGHNKRSCLCESSQKTRSLIPNLRSFVTSSMSSNLAFKTSTIAAHSSIGPHPSYFQALLLLCIIKWSELSWRELENMTTPGVKPRTVRPWIVIIGIIGLYTSYSIILKAIGLSSQADISLRPYIHFMSNPSSTDSPRQMLMKAFSNTRTGI